jgi:hypothetical protein
MAIAFDAHSRVIGTSGSSATLSHTCSGVNRLLFAYIKLYNNGSAVNGVTGVTYNSVAMSLIDNQTDAGPGNSYLYYLIAPATGANNIAVTCSGSNAEINIVGFSYTGCLQSGVPDASAKSNGASPRTISLTTVADNCWLAGGFSSDAGAAISAGTDTTRRSAAGLIVAMDSNGAKATPGSYSLQATAASGNIAGIVASFAPSTSNTGSLFFAQY